MTAPLATVETLEVPAPRVYHIPAYRLPLLEHKFEVTNRRLARAGLAPFCPVYEPYEVKVTKGGIELEDGTTMFGTTVTEPWIKVTLEVFEIKAGEYAFVAALVGEEGGYTVHCAPGQSLDGWARPPRDDVHCDHCGVHRDRKRIYILREEATGKLIQVGHSCIELYTGCQVKGLWALTYDDELSSFEREDSGGGFGSREYGAPVDKVLAYSFAFSDSGKSYRSVKAAEFNDFAPTSHEVRAALTETIRPPQRSHFGRDGRGYEKAVERYERFLANMREGDRIFKEEPELIAEIRQVASVLKPGTDYADNMHVCLAGEYVSGRNFGVVASLVSVYAREKEIAVERERKAKLPPLVQGFLAEEGKRIRNFSITVKRTRWFENDWGSSTMVVGVTPDNYEVVWFASHGSYEEGEVIPFEAATVKRHRIYEPEHGDPIYQTTIFRCIIDDFDERAAKLARDIRQNGSEYEPVQEYQVKVPWALGQLPAGIYAPSRWVTVGYDETKPLSARWLKNKAEVKRFKQWVIEHPDEGDEEK